MNGQSPPPTPKPPTRAPQSQPGAFHAAAVEIMARVEAERERLAEKARRMERESK